MITSGPILPIWFTAPIALILMIAISVHAATLRRSSSVPPSRRRIRQANAWLSVLTLALLLAGFSLVDPVAHEREWMLIWIAAMMMLLFVIALAILDVANTMRLTLRWRRSLRERLGQTRAERRTEATDGPPTKPNHERS